ncbi:ATP-dependent DNA helicase RecG [Janibacter melonis]|uniref:Probable DNA 3'-5' helicase RecG n=1 Tax=Janibacter melonis TaxID=262209 RepID=A0A176QAF4_9MICO|nr:ATP-dependent DNA helicase RecG [Janibacter melonis]OAB86660.1 ATP-dependent DNA helicase RecG [Janibacter melonis]
MTTEDTRLKGLVGSAASKLEKHRGIVTVGDLLDFAPRRYRTTVADLGVPAVGDYLVAVATVESATTRTMKSRRGKMLEAVITDGRSRMDVTFFSAYGHEKELQVGRTLLFAGRVGEYRGRRQLAHPAYSSIEALHALGDLAVDEGGLIPIYRHVPGVQSWGVSAAVRVVLQHLDEVVDAVPDEVRERRDLLGRLEALTALHAPHTLDDVERARHRLRFEEAFVLQCLLGMRRAERAAEVTRARRPDGQLLATFDERLPFELTAGQREVGETVLADLAADTPMHRLLQGEVGSGKTVVALRAMLAAVDSGGQAALLAPTEVLAVQHERTIRGMLGDLAEEGMLGGAEDATRVQLLTGSMSTQARREALIHIATGAAGIVVGTHALLEDVVTFDDLALVVVDEQHRFGVEQRDALRAKGEHPPHLLVMTATPIPRTVAMTVFGDMATSTLRELPRGRQPVTTHVVPAGNPRWVQRVWERIAEEVAAGRQAFVVCPRIGGDDDVEEGVDLLSEGPVGDDEADGERVPDDDAPRPLADVSGTLELLAHVPALAGVSTAALHGRMRPEEKDAVMSAYAAGEIDVLVATTVIEVGVDVPNASTMVVLDADRFGISQLHQLRGRIGRGGHPGVCLLVTGSDAESAQERLQALASTSDGFELARVDLAQRREGDVLGTAQSGVRSQLRHLSLLRDEDLIEAAREDVEVVLAADPDLSAHPELAAAVARWADEERTAYLEKS